MEKKLKLGIIRSFRHPTISSRALPLLTIVILAGIALGAFWLWRSTEEPTATTEMANPNSSPPGTSTVEAVVDGITIQLESGHLVRYLGVRVPSTGNPVQCFGRESIKANEAIVGKKVRLETDPLLGRSADGAWVRYVWLVLEASTSPIPSPNLGEGPTPSPAAFTPSNSLSDEGEDQPPLPASPADGSDTLGVLPAGDSPGVASSGDESSNEIFINERILEGGFGFPVVSPEMKYGERMLAAARFASATGKGLWGRCEVQESEGVLQTQAETECLIKGKVTREFEKLYRTPECAGYEQTLVLESRGGRWFCAEDIARDAGFTLAPDCPTPEGD